MKRKKDAEPSMSTQPRPRGQWNSTWPAPRSGRGTSTASIGSRALRLRLVVLGEAVSLLAQRSNYQPTSSVAGGRKLFSFRDELSGLGLENQNNGRLQIYLGAASDSSEQEYGHSAKRHRQSVSKAKLPNALKQCRHLEFIGYPTGQWFWLRGHPKL